MRKVLPRHGAVFVESVAARELGMKMVEWWFGKLESVDLLRIFYLSIDFIPDLLFIGAMLEADLDTDIYIIVPVFEHAHHRPY